MAFRCEVYDPGRFGMSGRFPASSRSDVRLYEGVVRRVLDVRRVCEVSAWVSLSRLTISVLGIFVTSSRATWLPIKPAPPVTTNCVGRSRKELNCRAGRLPSAPGVQTSPERIAPVGIVELEVSLILVCRARNGGSLSTGEGNSSGGRVSPVRGRACQYRDFVSEVAPGAYPFVGKSGKSHRFSRYAPRRSCGVWPRRSGGVRGRSRLVAKTTFARASGPLAGAWS